MSVKRALCVGAACFALVSATKAQGAWDDLTFETLDAMATNVLTQAQKLSFRNDLEYCGFVAFDTQGKLRATRPMGGGKSSCAPDAPNDWELVASYHTHGAVDRTDPDASFEMPSTDDVEGDMAEGVDGYVATPGGRFWFIDGLEGTATLLGGMGTLPKDPNYHDLEECEVEWLTLDDLHDIETGDLDPCAL